MLRLYCALVTDHTRMAQLLEKLDLVRKLQDLILFLVGECNALDRDDSAGVEIERTVNGAELASTNAFAELLSKAISVSTVSDEESSFSRR